MKPRGKGSFGPQEAGLVGGGIDDDQVVPAVRTVIERSASARLGGCAVVQGPRVLTDVNAASADDPDPVRSAGSSLNGSQMATTGISTIDHAPQVVAEWLNELCDDLEWPEKPRAYLLMRETLHAVRDMLTVDEATDLAAQLPVLIRGIYFEGWDPSKTPIKERKKSDFLDRIGARFQKEPLDDPERAVAAVFDLLRRHVSFGEFEHVRDAMRKPIQDLWN